MTGRIEWSTVLGFTVLGVRPLSHRSARRGAPVVLLLDIDYATLTKSTA